MSANGLISLGRAIDIPDPEQFPSDIADIHWSYIVAPFWADFDASLGGTVSWSIEQNTVTVVYVSEFIQSQYGDEDFVGNWMLIVNWEDMQPSYGEVRFIVLLLFTMS